ncbi:MAG: hypothetical protein HOP12_08150 [Candidatus Eisenbacteria bacterium]|uniref:Uncharacterized protein n=1 Tax=Eiseniibacteriota bacterium TaxID=2212470 RepID=A0A849SNE0_UNCEI|nr:hypothetical protein [Candidatus Eisenbacteria bacterium]
MSQPVRIAVVALFVALLGATFVLYQKYQQTSANYATLQATEAEAQNRYTQSINAIAEIQDSLGAIAFGHGGTLNPAELQGETHLTQTQGNEILGRIAVLKAGIDRAKTRISDLEAGMKKSGVRIVGMQRMVDGLKRSVVEKEELVASLTSRVTELQTQVTGLQTTVAQDQTVIAEQTQAIEDKRREIGTVYYLIGNRKDLTTSGVVASTGGVLGLGKTLKPSGEVNETLFTPIDTDQQTVIQIPAAKVQVLSAQPVGSYELLTVGNQTELRIKDPSAFRKVKHVVILTT